MASPERRAPSAAPTLPSGTPPGTRPAIAFDAAQTGDGAGPQPRLPTLNSALAKEALTRFIAAQVGAARASGVVLGLSGGIDSAVVAALSVEALGRDAVLGLLLPSPHSAAADRHDALAVAQRLGMRSETIPLAPLVEAWRAAEPSAARDREGNLTARLRMALLYDRSLRDGSLVAGTSNKTEILLGYTTLWGDMAAAFVPLGDLYKTQVRALAAFLDVPEAVRRRPPTAGLWPGQTDEDELGSTYEALDALLHHYVDLRYDPAALVAAGFEESFTRRTVERVHRNEFKRRMPLVPKLSTRTVGHDFLYPRQWRGPEAATGYDDEELPSTRGRP